ncbi:MAG: D-sedoheptulose-7-phosphate isomerase [Chloroflexota bacterium]
MHREIISQGSEGTPVGTILASRRATLSGALSELMNRPGDLARVAELLVRTLRRGRKVLAAGNGGSAAEAQHFVAELMGRFLREREAYSAVALTADSALLTAVANDYGYQEVFARQVQGLGRPDDVLLLFSTSGESANLLRAVDAARRKGITVVAITGGKPNTLAQLADLVVMAPARETAIVQELHMILTHVLCGLVEAELATAETDRGGLVPNVMVEAIERAASA